MEPIPYMRGRGGCGCQIWAIFLAAGAALFLALGVRARAAHAAPSVLREPPVAGSTR
ncbi:MAG TPA: hypothetical protein VFF73_30650 [Planctomycetota bacterium]|nr:hypothetical protein [Planctomycetota bacterium]